MHEACPFRRGSATSRSTSAASLPTARAKEKARVMIEAEWWDYETIDELADAVAGDVGFIIDSAIEARNASLIAVPAGRTGPAIFPKLAAQSLPWKRLTIIPTDARLQDLSWPPDLVWLGMGEDGHTASIFTGPDLQDALDAPKARRAVGVMPDPMPKDAPVARVTLTRAAILSARTILITIRGQEKRDLLEQAIEAGHSSKLP